MLVEDCNQLNQLAQTATDLRKYASDLGKFRDRQAKIEELVSSLKPLVIALRAFRDRKLVSNDFSQQANVLLAEVGIILDEFQKDRGWLIEKPRLNSLQSKINECKSKLESQLRRAWGEYKNRRFPNTNDDLLGLLAKIQTFKPTVHRVRALLAQLATVDYPRDAAHFQEIEQAIENLTEAWNSLKSDEVPPVVLEFLRAAATHGASIDRLTPEVTAWLNEQGISRFFYIRLSD
ncbi:hypothetical protein [Leptolyngbya sp. GGD]|uniref:hypothetical protein n=1 Tax=Leptolyngbya sp. GGD TaxID=2997907 RepID=UPI00227AC67E|nr:hypothetical protein [Leptolyngbya sp. GGD]MCY6493404.1 hypothetical protein [Leptolyngbya sp. GGD]